MAKPGIPEIEEWQPEDFNKFHSLIDRADEDFLRRTLPRADFFRLKRSRIRVLWRYVRQIAHNSAAVRRHVAHAQRNPDVNVAKLAREVTDLASQVRAQCRVACAKLAVEYMFPRFHLRRNKN